MRSRSQSRSRSWSRSRHVSRSRNHRDILHGTAQGGPTPGQCPVPGLVLAMGRPVAAELQNIHRKTVFFCPDNTVAPYSENNTQVVQDWT